MDTYIDSQYLPQFVSSLRRLIRPIPTYLPTYLRVEMQYPIIHLIWLETIYRVKISWLDM